MSDHSPSETAKQAAQEPTSTAFAPRTAGSVKMGASETSASETPSTKAEDSAPTVKVALEILGSEQTFVCRAGEEERLRAHSRELEKRLVALGGEAESSDKTRFLIAAALQLADELYETHREHEAEVRELRDGHLREVEQLQTAERTRTEARSQSDAAEAEKRAQAEAALRQRLEHLLALLSDETPSQTYPPQT